MEGDINIIQILWQSGVVVKAVLLILILSSILSWAIIFQKRRALAKVEYDNNEFIEFFSNNDDLDDINSRAESLQDSNISLMFKKGYGELNKIKEKINDTNELKTYVRGQGIAAMERSLKLGVNQSNEYLDKQLSTLATIGSVSPFIGLFGTVWGIINSFTGMSSGGGSIETIAPGIAEALVATAVGLFAAIPAVWFFNIFNNKISQMNLRMESFGQDFLNLIERNHI